MACHKRYLILLTTLISTALILFSAPTFALETKISHSSLKSIASSTRTNISVKVTDPAGIQKVRAYFRSNSSDQYNFVKLIQTEPEKSLFSFFPTNKRYTGQLPAAGEGTSQIEYVILAVNNNQEIVKSAPYIVDVTPGENTEKGNDDDELTVYTELSEAPQSIEGFSDSILFDVAESSARYGMVAGLVNETTTATAAATSSNSTAAGTVEAAAISTTAVAGIVGGALALSGGGGGGGGGSSSGGTAGSSSASSTSTTGCAFTGICAGGGSASCAGQQFSASGTLNINDSCQLSVTIPGVISGAFVTTVNSNGDFSASQDIGCGGTSTVSGSVNSSIGSATFGGAGTSGVLACSF